MVRTRISQLWAKPEEFSGKTLTVCGWARTLRDMKNFGFIELNDGSSFKGVQIVFEREKIENYDEIAHLNVGASVVVTGTLVLTPEAKQPFEIKADSVTVEGTSTPDYPLQKKRHTVEYLREQAYLRPRTNLFSAVFRVRSEVAYAIHSFFRKLGQGLFPSLGLLVAAGLGYVAALGPDQAPEVAANMRYLVGVMYLIGAALQFIAIKFIYNLDKKTLNQMTEELNSRKV